MSSAFPSHPHHHISMLLNSYLNFKKEQLPWSHIPFQILPYFLFPSEQNFSKRYLYSSKFFTFINSFLPHSLLSWFQDDFCYLCANEAILVKTDGYDCPTNTMVISLLITSSIQLLSVISQNIFIWIKFLLVFFLLYWPLLLSLHFWPFPLYLTLLERLERSRTLSYLLSLYR